MNGVVARSRPIVGDDAESFVVPGVVAAPSRGSFERRRTSARRALTVLVLIAVGATSAVQIQGFTLTMLAPVCLLLAPALLLTRPSLGQWLPLALAVIGFAAFCVSAQINHLSLVDQRVQQWAAFALYFVGFLVLAGRDLLRIFSIYCGIAIGAAAYSILPVAHPQASTGRRRMYGNTVWDSGSSSSCCSAWFSSKSPYRFKRCRYCSSQYSV